MERLISYWQHTSRIHKEIVFGIIGILILCVLTAFDVARYQRTMVVTPGTGVTASIDPATILTGGEIAKHNTPADCWITIESKVYVVSGFLSRHPGGAGLITPYCSRDATQAFLTKAGKGAHSAQALRLLGLIYIGDVNKRVVRQPDTKGIQSIPVEESEEDDD